MAGYLRTLADNGIDADVVGSVVATATFGAAKVAVHTTSDARWEWRAARAPVRDVTLVVFVLRGSITMSTPDGGQQSSNSGEAFLLHSARPARVSWSEAARYAVIMLPTDGIVGSGLETDDLPETFQRTTLLAATREFVLALSKERGPTARFSTYVAERLLAEMAFGLVLEGRDAAMELTRGSLAEQARAIMLVRRAEPDLSAAAIAADLHVSVRQLQRAFAREDSSPAAALRTLRVELAQSMLRDSQFDGLSIDQVAQYSGFTSTSAMRRAFEAQGKTAPSVVRRSR